MKTTEITLNSPQQLKFPGDKIATVERRYSQGRDDSLNISFATGNEMELAAAVDVSQQLEYPRIFGIEGSKGDTLLLFGGERAYWVKNTGQLTAELQLTRRWAESEHWTTHILKNEETTILIYEAGVLVIDDSLAIVWHKPKLLNDEFVAIEGAALKFARDQDQEWLMLLKDGSSSPK